MVSMLSLLIPLALSAVLVFIASSIVHMMTPLHKGDLKRLPNEDAVMNALRPLNIAAGRLRRSRCPPRKRRCSRRSSRPSTRPARWHS